MRTILYIIFLTLLTSCITSNNNYIDSRTSGDRFIDSLISAGQKTIIGYYDGCSGCIDGLEKPYYVFWASENKWYLTKFTIYSKFNKIAGHSPPFRYISDNYDIVGNSNLDIPNFQWSHFRYEVIRIILNGKEISYEIKAYEKMENESNPKVILIDKIRSDLLNINPWEWQTSD